MRNAQLYTFYSQNMVLEKGGKNHSKSPQKPKLLLNFLERHKLIKHFEIKDDFQPFSQDDFYLAHTKNYVDAFFAGKKPLAVSNGLTWTPQFADSVRYTNASLYYAIKSAIEEPEKVSFSPVSGFHHAQPQNGLGYCTFSGQVIASVKIFRETGMKGAYIDLDGHFGNSIEDSRSYVSDLNLAIPKGIGNINPADKHYSYISNLRRELGVLRDAIQQKRIDYLVFCHGADSHEEDDTKGQCTTAEWLECSEIFYDFVRKADEKRQKPLPLILCLFGGYRKDDYNSVLSLHTADLVMCLNKLCGQSIDFQVNIKPKKKKH
jgi:acetoin utilization deacetylase AcuC-like enzyme